MPQRINKPTGETYGVLERLKAQRDGTSSNLPPSRDSPTTPPARRSPSPSILTVRRKRRIKRSRSTEPHPKKVRFSSRNSYDDIERDGTDNPEHQSTFSSPPGAHDNHINTPSPPLNRPPPLSSNPSSPLNYPFPPRNVSYSQPPPSSSQLPQATLKKIPIINLADYINGRHGSGHSRPSKKYTPYPMKRVRKTLFPDATGSPASDDFAASIPRGRARAHVPGRPSNLVSVDDALGSSSKSRHASGERGITHTSEHSLNESGDPVIEGNCSAPINNKPRNSDTPNVPGGSRLNFEPGSGYGQGQEPNAQDTENISQEESSNGIMESPSKVENGNSDDCGDGLNGINDDNNERNAGERCNGGNEDAEMDDEYNDGEKLDVDSPEPQTSVRFHSNDVSDNDEQAKQYFDQQLHIDVDADIEIEDEDENTEGVHAARVDVDAENTTDHLVQAEEEYDHAAHIVDDEETQHLDQSHEEINTEMDAEGGHEEKSDTDSEMQSEAKERGDFHASAIDDSDKLEPEPEAGVYNGGGGGEGFHDARVDADAQPTTEHLVQEEEESDESEDEEWRGFHASGIDDGDDESEVRMYDSGGGEGFRDARVDADAQPTTEHPVQEKEKYDTEMESEDEEWGGIHASGFDDGDDESEAEMYNGNGGGKGFYDAYVDAGAQPTTEHPVQEDSDSDTEIEIEIEDGEWGDFHASGDDDDEPKAEKKNDDEDDGESRAAHADGGDKRDEDLVDEEQVSPGDDNLEHETDSDSGSGNEQGAEEKAGLDVDDEPDRDDETSSQEEAQHSRSDVEIEMASPDQSADSDVDMRSDEPWSDGEGAYLNQQQHPEDRSSSDVDMLSEVQDETEGEYGSEVGGGADSENGVNDDLFVSLIRFVNPYIFLRLL
jgi:hypothetical protein